MALKNKPAALAGGWGLQSWRYPLCSSPVRGAKKFGHFCWSANRLRSHRADLELKDGGSPWPRVKAPKGKAKASPIPQLSQLLTSSEGHFCLTIEEAVLSRSHSSPCPTMRRQQRALNAAEEPGVQGMARKASGEPVGALEGAGLGKGSSEDT